MRSCGYAAFQAKVVKKRPPAAAALQRIACPPAARRGAAPVALPQESPAAAGRQALAQQAPAVPAAGRCVPADCRPAPQRLARHWRQLQRSLPRCRVPAAHQRRVARLLSPAA